METISLRIESDLLKEIDSSLKPHRYGTRTEFIRSAIRRKLSDIEKEVAIKKLESMFGTMKPKNNMSDAEAGRLAFEELAKKHGIKLD